MGKKRFGISIPEDVAEDLDRLAVKLGMNRSSLVERALSAFLEDYAHLLIPHQCSGVLILSCSASSESTISSIVERYRDVASSRVHTHVASGCIEALVVSGDTGRISRLHSDLEKAGCTVRYIPIQEVHKP